MTRSTAVLIVLLGTVACDAPRQGVADVYRALPAELAGGLSVGERQRLLAVGHLRPSGNTPEEIAVHRVTEPVSADGSDLRVEMRFETGQRGFTVIELRRWTHADGAPVFGVSTVAGTPALVDQAELRFFRFHGGRLVELEELIPARLTMDAFVRPGIPDSLRAAYEDLAAAVVRLHGEDGVAYWVLRGAPGPHGIDESWLLGNAIRFRWTGTAFERSEPQFLDEP
jgi:hypothetical protein